MTVHDVSSSVLPSIVKLIILYPFVYYSLHLLMCAPYGILDPLRLQCKCPYFRTGDYCETCKIDASRGECALTTRRCKDKWMGALCDYCPALDGQQGTCKGECNTTNNWYNSGDTTKCRNCTASFHCSGHGTCNTLMAPVCATKAGVDI